MLSGWDDELFSTPKHNISSNATIKTPLTFSIKYYFVATVHILFFIAIIAILVAANKQSMQNLCRTTKS